MKVPGTIGPAGRASGVWVAMTVLLSGSVGQRPWLDRCLDAEPAQRWRLPAAFREASGLALSEDGRLFVHNDEQGLVLVIDSESGRVLGTYRLGPTTPRDDFEGLAILGDRMFLISSAGTLYQTVVPEKAPVEMGVLPYRVEDTGLGGECEIEGLASDPSGILLVACKTPRQKALEDWMTVFRWDPVRRALATPDRIQVPLRALAKGRPGKRFRPSGVERHPGTGDLLVIASADQAIAELGPDGAHPRARALPKRHRQAEGIAITPQGELILADEGGHGRGEITVYACR